jgi:hypothetical protein
LRADVLIQVIVLLSQSILNKEEKRNIIKADSDSFHPNITLPTGRYILPLIYASTRERVRYK